MSGMAYSRNEWQDRTIPKGRSVDNKKSNTVDAARYGSSGALLSTPTDYATFVIEVIDPKPSDAFRKPEIDHSFVVLCVGFTPLGEGAQHRYAFQWACGVGAFINSTNILLNLARSKSIWISTSCAPSFGLSLSVHVSVFP
jgi:hypothetical protein